MIQLLNEIKKDELIKDDIAMENRIEIFKYSMTIMLIVFVICIILTIILASGIIISITSPIKALQNLIKRMEEGELNIEIPNNYRYEFRDMFSKFKRMSITLSNLINEAKQTSVNVSSATLNIVNSSKETNNSISTFSSILHNLATNVDNQLEGLKESSIALDSISSVIQQIANLHRRWLSYNGNINTSKLRKYGN